MLAARVEPKNETQETRKAANFKLLSKANFRLLLTVASMIHGSRGWDADCGDDCEDPPRVFWTGQVDQGDLP
jgi:hypothetical protein